jgi:hypothetical protein
VIRNSLGQYPRDENAEGAGGDLLHALSSFSNDVGQLDAGQLDACIAPVRGQLQALLCAQHRSTRVSLAHVGSNGYWHPAVVMCALERSGAQYRLEWVDFETVQKALDGRESWPYNESPYVLVRGVLNRRNWEDDGKQDHDWHHYVGLNVPESMLYCVNGNTQLEEPTQLSGTRSHLSAVYDCFVLRC